MADKKEPPAEDGVENAADGETRAETRRFGETRRRLPLAALAVLLALIGVGIYVAWPSIQDSLQTSPPEQAAAAVEENAGVEPPPEPIPAADVEPAPALKQAPAAPPEPSPALIALSAQIAALERALAERDAAPAPPALDLTPIHDAMARLEEMEKRLNEAPPAVAAESTVPAKPSIPIAPRAAANFRTLERLDALEDALRGREPGVAVEELRDGQAALREQVAALRQVFETIGRREAESGHTMVLVLSLARLSRAAATAEPFAREVEALSAAAGADGGAGLALENAIRELAAHALGGTPTAAQLAAAFDDVALAVIHADAAAEDQGWVDATIGRLRRIVTVRRVGGDIRADSLEGRLSALHQALAGGDLAAAIALAEALPAKARGGADNWLRGARARLAVERALGVLDTEISARVAARWAPGGREGK